VEGLLVVPGASSGIAQAIHDVGETIKAI